MSYGINTECIYTHSYIVTVHFNELFRNIGIFSVEVNAVTVNLCILTCPVVPVKALPVSVVVVVFGIENGVA